MVLTMRERTFVVWSAALIAVGSACADNTGSSLHSGPSTTTSGTDVTTGGGGGTTTATTVGSTTVATVGAGGSTVGTGAGGNTSGGGAGAGGAGGGGAGTGGAPVFSRPQGKLPNAPLPATMVNLPRADWQKGLVSPTIQDHKHVDYPGALNGYLSLNGNEEFWFYDISDRRTRRCFRTSTRRTAARRAAKRAKARPRRNRRRTHGTGQILHGDGGRRRRDDLGRHGSEGEVRQDGHARGIPTAIHGGGLGHLLAGRHDLHRRHQHGPSHSRRP